MGFFKTLGVGFAAAVVCAVGYRTVTGDNPNDETILERGVDEVIDAAKEVGGKVVERGGEELDGILDTYDASDDFNRPLNAVDQARVDSTIKAMEQELGL